MEGGDANPGKSAVAETPARELFSSRRLGPPSFNLSFVLCEYRLFCCEAGAKNPPTPTASLMQPFARPAARLIWGHARLGFDQVARPAKSFGGAAVQRPTICLRCSVRAIGARGRFYSSQLPPKDPETTSSSSPGPKADSEASVQSRPVAQSLDGQISKKSTRSHELPSTTDDRRGDMNQKFSHFMDNLQSRVLTASQTLNDITGYTGIEAIKRQNSELETRLADAHVRVRDARLAYKTSNTRRAATQREVTTLLARKDGWSPDDLERFTELYRADHVLEGEVSSSQETLTEAEMEEQSLSQRLNAGMLKRYHEEQIWSDRIRRASTWGTWGLMGMNFLLFVVLQFVAEPWKRRRLVRGVVAEEKAVLEEVRGQLEFVKMALENRGDGAAAGEALDSAVELPDFELPAAELSVAELPVVEPVAAEPPAVGLPEETAVAEEAEFTEAFPTATILDPEGAKSPSSLSTRWDACKEFLRDPARWRMAAEDLYSERRVDLRMKDASLLALEGAAAGAVLAGSVALLLVRNR
ncbi:hypothetical protein G7046_g4504 [Stylonectria norvegica]|nr:hypothetical protein G7046_g4504 [Stylonectria norvegica]